VSGGPTATGPVGIIIFFAVLFNGSSPLALRCVTACDWEGVRSAA